MKKKIICLVLAVVMALLVSGCAEDLQDLDIPPFPEVTPTPVPVSPTQESILEMIEAQAAEGAQDAQPGETSSVVITEPEDHIRVLVTIGNTTLQSYDPAEGTELILTFSYDMPRVYDEASPDAAARINETLATVEEIFYTGNSYGMEGDYSGYSAMLTAAEDNFTYVYETGAEGMSLELSDTLSAHVNRLDDRILSVTYSEYCYTGGAHGWYGSRGYNFDVTNGELLTLDSLSEDSDALREFLLGEMQRMIAEDEDEYYSQRVMEEFLYDKTMEEALRDLLREGSWYFTNDGLVVFSDLYELGPYAAGIVEFVFPYETLAGRIRDEYLYPGARTGKGNLQVTELSELEGGNIEIVDKLTLNEDGEELCLVATGRIYDVTISEVYYLDRFYESRQLWSASFLENCALQVQVVVPEGLPNLQISYTTADGERHGKLLSQSGQDGSYMLVDDDIEAVG